MKERPILFSGPMVRALLAGNKTQTRRVVKHIPAMGHADEWCPTIVAPEPGRANSIVGDYRRFCHYGQPGDRLWVRETFLVKTSLWAKNHGPQPVHYAADVSPAREVEDHTGKPSIHMPRWASRIDLCLTGVRVERLKEISEEDAKAEGVRPETADWVGAEHAKACYASLWESIHGEGSWAANPWVWVLEFERVTA